ncbi:MAG: Holliday junction resolvase [Thermoplasmata archaeon]
MSHTSSSYERELKMLLEADPESLRRYAPSLDPTERGVIERLRVHPFLVVRAAGSLGFDLVALRREFAFPIEVKSSRSDTIRFSAASGRAAEQLEEHRRRVERVGLLVLYAYRRLGLRSQDPWRLYTPEAPDGRGRLDLLRRHLPRIDSTREGNAVMRWDSGMPLSRFLEVVTSLVEPAGA